MSFRHEITFGEVLEMIEGGWFPAWAAVGEDPDDEGMLLVDWCVLWRLQDRKILFTETPDISADQKVRFLDLCNSVWAEEAKCFARNIIKKPNQP